MLRECLKVDKFSEGALRAKKRYTHADICGHTDTHNENKWQQSILFFEMDANNFSGNYSAEV